MVIVRLFSGVIDIFKNFLLVLRSFRWVLFHHLKIELNKSVENDLLVG